MRLINANDKYYPTLRGIASTLDLYGSGNIGFYRKAIFGRSDLKAFQIDRDAIRSDWIVVGKDLFNAIDKVSKDVKK